MFCEMLPTNSLPMEAEQSNVTMATSGAQQVSVSTSSFIAMSSSDSNQNSASHFPIAAFDRKESDIRPDDRPMEMITIDSSDSSDYDSSDSDESSDDEVIFLFDNKDKDVICLNDNADYQMTNTKTAATSQNISTTNLKAVVSETPSIDSSSEHLNSASQSQPELSNDDHRCQSAVREENDDGQQQKEQTEISTVNTATTSSTTSLLHDDHINGQGDDNDTRPTDIDAEHNVSQPNADTVFCRKPFSSLDSLLNHQQAAHLDENPVNLTIDQRLLAENQLNSEEHRQCKKEFIRNRKEPEAEDEEPLEEEGTSGQLSHSYFADSAAADTQSEVQAITTAITPITTTSEPKPMIKKKRLKKRKRRYSFPPKKPKQTSTISTATKTSTHNHHLLKANVSTLSAENELWFSQTASEAEEEEGEEAARQISLEPLVIALRVSYETGQPNEDDLSARYVCQRTGCEKEFKTLLNLKIHDRTHRKGRCSSLYRCRYQANPSRPDFCNFADSLKSNVLWHVHQSHTSGDGRKAKRPGPERAESAGPRCFDATYLEAFIKEDRASKMEEEALWADALEQVILKLAYGKAEEEGGGGLPLTFALRVRCNGLSPRYHCRRPSCSCGGTVEFDSVAKLVEHFGGRRTIPSRKRSLNRLSTDVGNDLDLDMDELEDIATYERSRKSRRSL